MSITRLEARCLRRRAFLLWPTPALLFALGVVVNASCSKPALPRTNEARDVTRTLQHDGVERTYHVHLPPEFDRNKPAPLVFALHGGGGRGKTFDQSATRGTLTAAADKRGVVLVYPEGVNSQWCDGRTEPLKTNRSYDDVGFLSAVIDAMAKEYGIDLERVYSTGISNGGFMSVRLAMDLSDRIAAVAPVTAQLSKAIEGKTPKEPISLMIVNGTEDPLVPFKGGHVRVTRLGASRGEILSTAATVERFRRFNGCGAVPVKTKAADKDPNDGTTVEIDTYGGGREGTEVVQVTVVGGGHTWPGGYQYLQPWLVGKVCRDIDASEIILDFFLRHTLEGSPKPAARVDPEIAAQGGTAPRR